MRISATRPVRVRPVPREERPQEVQDLLTRATKDPDRDVNIYSTLVNHPRLYEKWLDLAHGILFYGELEDRDRELLVMRTAWNCESEYEWAQHRRFATQAGITDDELLAIENGPADPGWSDRDRTLLEVADQLHDRKTVEDGTWAALAEYFDQRMCMEITMTVGVYVMVAMMLNTFGVQLDDGLVGYGDR